MLRLGVRSNAQRQRIVALGELLVRHVLPRLGSLHVFRFLDGEIKATLGSDERHNYVSAGGKATYAEERVQSSCTKNNLSKTTVTHWTQIIPVHFGAADRKHSFSVFADSRFGPAQSLWTGA